jgi:RNA polymerase sigma-70 factor (ECF subfamily)
MDTHRPRIATLSNPPWGGEPRPRRPEDAERERDVLLVGRVAAGGAAGGDALAELFDRHAPAALGLLEGILGAGGEAEEVLQEVFLQVWRQAHRYRAPLKSVRGWLLLLARSRALDRLRSDAARRRREERLRLDDGGGGVGAGPAQMPEGSARLERSERRRQLAAALRLLPAEQRQAVELVFFAGLTHSQVAARLGAPLGTVKSRVLLGMKRLRRLLPVAAAGRFAAAAAA